MALTKTKRIIFCGAFAGLMLVLSGCASTSERSSTQSLKAEDTARAHEQVGGASYSRKQLPELNEASGLNDCLAYAALNNPQMEAAFNRWKAALEMVTQARTLPDPRFNYGYFIQEVETRVGPQEQRAGLSQMFSWFGKLKLRGEVVLEGANAERDGKTFYFCSEHCRQKFLSTPAGAKPEGKSGCCCG
jgi:hypothetical protein